MWSLQELKAHRSLIDRIDWQMTPEKAIETYLEWGTGWARHGDSVRYADQESIYFVIYDWEEPLQVTLIRRNTRDMTEIAKVEAPAELIRKAIEEGGKKPGVGVYAINDALEQWLRSALGC